MLLGRMQRQLVQFYALESPPPVEAFVRSHDDIDRERVLVRQADGAIELSVELPSSLLQDAAQGLDALAQLVEGVSHFVLLAERARRELPTSQLELELQAEVDKWVLLASGQPRDQREALRTRLFDDARFIDPPGTVLGDRYRQAHRLAQRLIDRFERHYLRRQRHSALQATLRRFYSAGPMEKLAFAAVA